MTKPKKMDKGDLLQASIDSALREQLPADLAQQRAQKKIEIPSSPVIVTSPSLNDTPPTPAPVVSPIKTEAQPPPLMTLPPIPAAIMQPISSPQSFGILGKPPKPLAKSKTGVKIGVYIEPPTKKRVDEVLFRFAMAGAKNDMSDLVETGLSRLLDQIETGLSGDTTPDAYDIIDDVEDLLQDLLRDSSVDPKFFGRAEELVSKIKVLKS